MTICKWCRRLESEHIRFADGKRCVALVEFGPVGLCDLSGNHLFFTPDDSPTGKLIAAALERAESVKENARRALELKGEEIAARMLR